MIVISLYGPGNSLIVELLDDDLDAAKHIAEEMFQDLKNIDWSASGIRLTVVKNGFTKEEWIISFSKAWSKVSAGEPEKKWKKARQKMEQK